MSRKTTGFVAIFFYALVSAILTFVFLLKDMNESWQQQFSRMIEGTAHKPYVYRVFVPTIIRGVSAATPNVIEKNVAAIVETRLVGRKGAEFTKSWEPQYYFQYLTMVGLVFLCFFGFHLTMRRLTGEFYGHGSPVADFAPVFASLMLILFFRYTSTTYDPGTLLLFPLGILLVYLRKHLFFYIVFVLACFNKETAFLLIGLFLLRNYKDMKLAALAMHAVALGALWLGVKASLWTLYHDNYGGLVEFHLFDHNLLLLSKYLFSFVYTVLILGSIGLLAAVNWKEKPEFLRYGLLITILPLMGLASMFGKLDEIRDYYEAYPFMFLLGLLAVYPIKSEVLFTATPTDVLASPERNRGLTRFPRLQ